MKKYKLKTITPAFKDSNGIIHLASFESSSQSTSEYLNCSGLVFDEYDCEPTLTDFITCKDCIDKIKSFKKYLNSII
jgi:hypothetical protein